LAGFEFHGLVKIDKGYFGHTFILTGGCCHTGKFMFHLLEKRIAEAFAARLTALYGTVGPVQTEQPKQSSFGEVSVPAAFQLARQLKKAPRVIAQELSEAVGAIDGVAAMEIAGNGYLNLRLDRGLYGEALLRGEA